MVIYGWREKKIEIKPIHNHHCSNCNTKNLHAQTNRSYIHIFWIPFIPLNKKVYSICSYCKQSLSKNQMPPDLQQKAFTIKKEARTPWWYYIGLCIIGLISLPILSTILIHIFK